jgi:DNA-binding PucR family transcriptional regulator
VQRYDRLRVGRIVQEIMLTVRDVASLPGLGLTVVAGEDGLGREVTWIHVSELPDPSPWLEGGELLVTTGLGMGTRPVERRAYLRRLTSHGLAGLAFGLGFGYERVPRELIDEANRHVFPIVAVPYEVPFIAITKAAATQLASERLARLEHALAVHERLAEAVLEGRGLTTLLRVLCDHVACSASLVDERGRVLGECHAGRTLSFEHALQLPVVANGEIATLRVARDGEELDEEDRLVLHHGQTALAFELSRRRAVSAAELRLAGDLVDDLLNDRLEEGAVSRRLAAFGLDPDCRYAGLLAVGPVAEPAEQTRLAVARQLAERDIRHLSAARHDRAAFLVEATDEDDALALATELVGFLPETRLGIGRPCSGRALGRSLLEARAALDGTAAQVASYRDLGSLELLLGLPSAALEAFVDRVLGAAAERPRLLDSLSALLDCGCRWGEAADQLSIHRHTLRYRMEQLRKLTGRHPDTPSERMELWLAVRARAALHTRSAATG